MIDKDVLVGTWKGGADDGSGLRTMIYNFGIQFHEDGTGISYSWNNDADGYHEETTRLEWELPGENLIRIRYVDNSRQGEWENITFEISNFKGAYDSAYLKLTEKGKDEFFDCPEPLYKPHPTPLNKLEKWWKKLPIYFLNFNS